MPALYLFHRRTILGGDDLQPAAFFTATLRVVQLLFLLLPIWIHVVHEIIINQKNDSSSSSSSSSQHEYYSRNDYDNDDFLKDDNDSNNNETDSSCLKASQSGRLTTYNYYYLGILVLYTILSILYNTATLFFLERPLSRWSSYGAPTDTHLRNQKVARLLEFKLVYASLLLFMVWIVGIMAVLLAPHYYHCQGVIIQSQSSISSPSSSSSMQWYRILEDAQDENNEDESKSSYRSHRYYWTMLAPTIILLVTQLGEVIVSWTYLITLCAQPRDEDSSSDVFFVPLQQENAEQQQDQDAPPPNNQQQMQASNYYHEEQVHDARPGGLQHPHSSRRRRSSTSTSIPPVQNHELVEEMWAERCANLCHCLGMMTCFCFGGREVFQHHATTAGGGGGGGAARALIGHSDFGDVARALADYLETRGVLDVVPSDIVTGFLVLQQLQKQRIRAARRAVLHDLSSSLDPESSGVLLLPANGKVGGGDVSCENQRQNSLLMGCGSNSSRDMLLLSADIAVVSGSATMAVAAPTMGMMMDVTAAGANVNVNNIDEDDSLFVPLDSPPASANNNNCHKNQNVYQRSSQKGNNNSNGGNGSSSTTTSMAYHLSSPRTTATMDNIAVDDQHQHFLSGGGAEGGCYQAFSSPTSAQGDTRAAQQRQAGSRLASRILLQRNNFTDMLALEEGARYAKYALAIYTWVLYLYVNPMTGVFRLAGHAACSACSTSPNSSSNEDDDPTSPRDPRIVTSTIDESGRIEGDNCCHTHRSALLLAAGGLPSTALVYAQLNSRFNQNPYCILLDHEWRNVVVSIRGTFSLEDCITDVLIEPESLEKLGQDFGFDATNQYCHGGVFACARNIYRDLERHGLLDQLLLPSGAAPARYPDYNLRLVGHSLGSATCTLLSFLLRPKFPNLRVINYCPVGCCLTWEMATACQGWCTSFVLDSDIVPRLSVESMEVLRDEILDLIARIKVNKVEVAKRLVGSGGRQKSSFFNWCFDFPMDNDDFDNDNNNNDPSSSCQVEDLLYPPDQVPDTDYTRRLAQFKAIQEERRSTRALRVVKLYPPGKIIHLVKTGEQRACIHGIAKCLTCCTTNVGFVYTPVWINNDDLDDIVVNPHMGTDHFPNRIASVLENVAVEFGLYT